MRIGFLPGGDRTPCTVQLPPYLELRTGRAAHPCGGAWAAMKAADLYPGGSAVLLYLEIGAPLW